MGCGEERQCIWLPYPHHIDPWCAGVDFLNDIDYRSSITREEFNSMNEDLWARALAPVQKVRATVRS